ncbi:hypothetical protein P8881_19780 [Bacillus haynesii]|uniref:hypothetical protein n=1 Tax=Bacillus haynesii TaxID=1925021 RepID=UPI00227FDED3|nr:hypothetical protein [Bacillus haynesii]MCY8737575.1 hypothetical protein [Bacillus haynesii]MEC0709768.1 hypothetical protein [Bacillus haynesii]MEC0736853.1 hypothetical protein [Bacillus haynesii]
MKTIVVKTIFVVLFFISIFVNIALGFNLSAQKSAYERSESKAREQAAELTKVKKKLTDAQDSIKESETAYDSETKQLVKDFFKVQYEYTTKSYKSRFDKIKRYVSDGVYGQLTSAGIPDTPKVSFKNTITDLQLFLTQSDDNQVSGLVLLQTKYEIDGIKNPKVTQVFKIKVDNKRISELETVGTFAESIKES